HSPLISLYIVRNADTSPPLRSQQPTDTTGNTSQNVIVPPEQKSNAPANAAGPASALPDLAGQSVDDAVSIVQETGASVSIIYVKQGDVPVGQIVNHQPGPGAAVGPGDVVTLNVSQ